MEAKSEIKPPLNKESILPDYTLPKEITESIKTYMLTGSGKKSDIAGAIQKEVGAKKDLFEKYQVINAVDEVFHHYHYLVFQKDKERQETRKNSQNIKQEIVERIEMEKSLISRIRKRNLNWKDALLGLTPNAGHRRKEVFKEKYLSTNTDTPINQPVTAERFTAIKPKFYRTALKPNQKAHNIQYNEHTSYGGIMSTYAGKPSTKAKNLDACFSSKYALGEDARITFNVTNSGVADPRDPIQQNAAARAAYHAGKTVERLIRAIATKLAEEQKLTLKALLQEIHEHNAKIYALITESTRIKEQQATYRNEEERFRTGGSTSLMISGVIESKKAGSFYIGYGLGNVMMAKFNVKSQTIDTIIPARNWWIEKHISSLALPYQNHDASADPIDLPLINGAPVMEGDIFVILSDGMLKGLPSAYLKHEVKAPAVWLTKHGFKFRTKEELEKIDNKLAKDKAQEMPSRDDPSVVDQWAAMHNVNPRRVITPDEEKEGVTIAVVNHSELIEVMTTKEATKSPDLSYNTFVNSNALTNALQTSHRQAIESAKQLVERFTAIVIEEAERRRLDAVSTGGQDASNKGGDCSIGTFKPGGYIAPKKSDLKRMKRAQTAEEPSSTTRRISREDSFMAKVNERMPKQNRIEAKQEVISNPPPANPSSSNSNTATSTSKKLFSLWGKPKETVATAVPNEPVPAPVTASASTGSALPETAEEFIKRNKKKREEEKLKESALTKKEGKQEETQPSTTVSAVATNTSTLSVSNTVSMETPNANGVKQPSSQASLKPPRPARPELNSSKEAVRNDTPPELPTRSEAQPPQERPPRPARPKENQVDSHSASFREARQKFAEQEAVNSKMESGNKNTYPPRINRSAEKVLVSRKGSLPEKNISTPNVIAFAPGEKAVQEKKEQSVMQSQ